MIKFRTYLLWFALSAIHVLLFFNAETGFNALIFSALAVLVVTFFHRLQHEKMWWMAASCHLVAAVGAAWHHSQPVIDIYNFSFLVLGGYVLSAKSSLPVAFINGLMRTFLYTFVVTVFGAFRAAVNFGVQTNLGYRSLKRTSLYIAPISVTVIFYLFYGISNPDFFIDIEFPELNFDPELLIYAIFSLVLVCPLFFKETSKKLVELDMSKPDDLVRTKEKKSGIAIFGLSYENRQGVVMFAMLNTLIAVFLGFSIIQIFIPDLVSKPMGHSQQVHQGFEVLVVSIIMAILLIMFYFRGNQNFYHKKTKLVQLATLWIILNGILILFTCYKNSMYVDSFGLTYKRIWVFIGMILTAGGLYLTWKKIRQYKTNWYLIRQNAWVLYFVLASYTLVDWDRLITWYNPNYSEALDMHYILELGDSKLPYLHEMLKAGDVRVLPHQAEIEYQIRAMKLPSSWKEQTIDALWLQKYK